MGLQISFILRVNTGQSLVAALGILLEGPVLSSVRKTCSHRLAMPAMN